MTQIKDVFDILSNVVSFIGVLVLIYGFTKVLIQLIKNEIVRKDERSFFNSIQNLRAQIGLYILLSLDFLIVSDIIDSITHRNLDELTKLGIIIVIRIAIGHFLGKEISEIRKTNFNLEKK
jgi:uncharacterized membrane protein